MPIISKVEPKTYPTSLLQKDWSKRPCYHFATGDKTAQEVTDIIYDLQVRDDDVWLLSMPKSGTTWLQELAWIVLNDFNYDYALNTPLELRSPFVEMGLIYGNPEDVIKAFESTKSPRLMKSHRPLPLLPQQLWTKKPKVLCICRDPKDAMVSSYYFKRSFGFSPGKDLQEAVCNELQNQQETEEWINFYAEFYALRNEPWVYYTSYEKMKSNLREVILEVCQFLEKPINDEQMEKLMKHLSLEEMQKNPSVQHSFIKEKVIASEGFTELENNKFFRKGKVGSYKEELSPEVIEKLDNWVKTSVASHSLTLDELLLLK